MDDLRALGSPQWTSETNATGETTEDSGNGTKSKEFPRTGGNEGTALLALGGGALIVGCGLLIRIFTRCNKRTGLLAGVALLYLVGYVFVAARDEMVEVPVTLAEH